ncbi:G-protein coupled receptor 54-like [Amphiura filiformis]|uniref:G-protein coupled receptor 54-like n=1 Tax=Amphiura filiformis TaxID=82378 RepID=UPI003B21BA12
MEEDNYYDSFSYASSFSYYGHNATYLEDGEIVAIPIVFAIITVVGIIGNGCVIFVILRNKLMRTCTNYFIMNNAITDMVFLIICVPITGSQFLISDWIYGAFMCKFVVYMQYVSVQASCATLMAMTVDRYRVILHPMQSLHTRTVWRTMIINLFIWLGSFLLHIPIAIYYSLVETLYTNIRMCTPRFRTENGPVFYEIYAIIMFYILPFAVMFYCYGRILERVWRGRRQLASSSVNTLRRRRWKVTRMTLLVVVLFGLCWGPLHTVHLVTLFNIEIHRYVTSFCLCLSYSNSALNPFVYAFSGRRYRSLLVSSFVWKRGRPISGTTTPSRLTRNNSEHNHYTMELLHMHQNGHKYRNGSKRCTIASRVTSQNVEKYV